jgi:hypothetical protein
MLNETSTATVAATRTALKEWAVAVKALEEGREVLILRKGGIHEKRFPLEHREFLLYPTYDHQREDLLKPDFHWDLKEVLLMRCPPGKVRISAFARATDVWELRSAEALLALSPHFMWTAEYAGERLRWRPTQPLRVVALRVYRLPEPRIIDALPEYGGCLSWLELAEAFSLADVQPVLDDAAYAARIAPIRAILQSAISPER